MLKKIEVFKENDFSDKSFKNFLVHDSAYMKVMNFNFKAGQELPVHCHDIEGQLSIAVLEGTGQFLGDGGKTLDAGPGDVLIFDISEPHGVRAVLERPEGSRSRVAGGSQYSNTTSPPVALTLEPSGLSNL